MPDRYIDMNGLIDDEAAIKIAGENSNKVENENKELKTKLDIVSSTMEEVLKNQRKMEEKLEIRELEGEVLGKINNSQIGNSDAALISFLRERKDVVTSLKQIFNLIEA